MIEKHIHLRIKDAGCSIHNTDLAIESTDLELFLGWASDDSVQYETKFLWAEISGEAIGYKLVLFSWNFDVVFCLCQVADGGSTRMGSLWQWLQTRQLSSNAGNLDGHLLVVGELEHGFGCATVNQLDAENFNLRELDHDRDGELGWLCGSFADLFNAIVRICLGSSGWHQ